MADDLTSCAAFLFINEQVAAGVLTQAQADSYKAKYAELYRLTSNAIEREKDVLAKARDLRVGVRDEQIALEKARIRKEQLETMNEAAEMERRRLQALLSELDAKESALQAELNELRMRETDLSEDVAQLRRENEALVQPALDGLMQEISDARAETSRAISQAESLMSQKTEISLRIEELQFQIAAANNTAAALRSELMRVRGDPQRFQKAVDATKAALDSTAEEAARLRALIAARESDIEDQSTAVTQVAAVRRELDAKLLKYRNDIDAREAEVSTVEKSLKSERMQQKDLLERRVDMQTEEAEARATVRVAESEREATELAYERAKRELKRRTDALNTVLASIPTHEAAVTERTMELSRLRDEGKDHEMRLASVKREMDGLMVAFLREEGVERKHRDQLVDLIETCHALDSEKDRWHHEESLAHKQISTLKAQRDIKSRELGKLTAQRKTMVEQSKMKELQLIDLTKQLGDINQRLRQFAAMYDVVKNERNSYANAIQAASQSIAEMRERIKILHNEVDILQNESNAKDKALAKERQAHAVAAVQRDALRAEANKSAVSYRERQTTVEAQIMVIDKLNTIITGLERQMLALKRQYENAVETRNYTGIQLIDRNDELCILYEKSNIHEKTLGDGEKALRIVSEELRALRISAEELERQMHLARSRFPETPALAEKILELQRSLVLSRQVTEKICADLETPGTRDRWHALSGDDPDTETLKLRVSALEMRVNTAREEVLEKDLVLEEISSLTERLRGTAQESGIAAAAASGVSAAAGSETTGKIVAAAEPPGLALARQVNELQSKIKEITRKMMAVVSELSMYQATAIKLAAETTSATESLQAAEDAMRKGLAPSVAAEQQWQAWLRAATLPSPVQCVMRKVRTASILRSYTYIARIALCRDSSWIEPVKTTAVQRPNAYIPDAIGIPKPYGEFAPFRPSEPGAVMRHFRNPEPRDIEI